jgi:GNAT superfamily N-acetyltransferase
MIEVKQIRTEMTYDLRHKILRPHQGMEDCKYDTDDRIGSFHVGAFYQGQLISIASFCVENNPDFPMGKQYRLRAMATLEDYRRVGAGREVVRYAEDILKGNGIEFLWCKGRTTVQAYYQRLGFQAYGEVFDYPPIGPHIVMYKTLTG